MRSNKNRDTLDELLRKISDGTFALDDARALNELLRGDIDACERYLNHVMLEAELEREFAEQAIVLQPDSSGNAISLPTRDHSTLQGLPNQHSSHEGTTQRQFWRLFGLTACLAVVVVWIAFSFGTGSDDPEMVISPPADPIATLVFAEDCTWGGEEVLWEGGRLLPGVLSLRRGIAIVRFAGGAEVALLGPARLELISPGYGRLHEGEVHVRVRDGAEGFKVSTKAIDFVDIGTEFGVMALQSGAVELQVIHGRVACHSRHGSEQQLVDAGNALRFDDGRCASSREIAFRNVSFDNIVRQAKPRERPDLMTVLDGFHHNADTYEPEQIIKGDGWAGPWRLRNDLEKWPGDVDSTHRMKIVEDRFNHRWSMPGGRERMLEMPSGSSHFVRPLANPIDLSQDSIVYCSFMTHEPGLNQENLHRRGRDEFTFMLRSSRDYFGDSIGFGVAESQQARIQSGPGRAVVGPSRIPPHATLFWVGKILSREDSEDEIALRVYGQKDVLHFAEPATWDVLTRGMKSSVELDLVVLSCVGEFGRLVDEIRVGPTWRSVVPLGTLDDDE